MTQSELKSKLHYNPKTGLFTRLEINKYMPKRLINKPVGSLNDKKYLLIRVGGKKQAAHRLAWLYVYGVEANFIDHINHNRSDNRIENLRSVDRSTNARNANLRKDNKSGRVGICFHEQLGKWHSQMTLKGKVLNLGFYDDFEDAVKAREEAELVNNFHENHGNRI